VVLAHSVGDAVVGAAGRVELAGDVAKVQTGSTVTPTNFAARVWVTGGPVPGTTAVDTNVKNNTTYTYFVLADFNTGARSGVSNFQTAIK
jgi:hypothetical protein